MDPAILTLLDGCLAILRGEDAKEIDSSSPTFSVAITESDAEQYFDDGVEQILGDPLKVEFPKDLFRFSDNHAGESDPLTKIKQELENAGHDLDYDFKLEVYLPCVTEYLVARHELDRAGLETEAAEILDQPDPHAGANLPQDTEPDNTGTTATPADAAVLTGTLPGAANPAQQDTSNDKGDVTETKPEPQLVGRLPGAANPAQQVVLQPGTIGHAGDPAKSNVKPVPKGTPSVRSMRSRLTPQRAPAPEKGTLRAHPAWQRHWVLGLTEHAKGKDARLKRRIQELRFGDLEPGLDPFVRNQILADLTGVLTGNIDPELLDNDS